MPYCTISLKLLSPTAKKRQQLDDAMERYAAAFERLLRCVRPGIEGHVSSKTEIGRQIGLYMPQVDQLGVQPFKDALKRCCMKKHRIDIMQSSIFSMPNRRGKRCRAAKGSFGI